MAALRVFPHAALTLMVLAGPVGLAQAPAPASLAAGRHVQVTRSDGTTTSGTVAPAPADPLWRFITIKGTPLNFLLHQLVSVRLLGRDEPVVPSWPSARRTFPWAVVRTTSGQTLEVGINGWPRFDFVHDASGQVEPSAAWENPLTSSFRAIEAVADVATPPESAVPGSPGIEFAAIEATSAAKPIEPAEPQPSRRIEIVVVRPGGAVEAGAMVYASNGELSLLDATDEDGSVVFNLPLTGQWSVQVKCRDGAATANPVPVPPPARVEPPLQLAIVVPRR